jgi:thioredoxin 2
MTLVPCPQCEKINRVSISRAEVEAPICGACKTGLLIDHGVINLNGTSLLHLIGRAPLPIVVDFWSPGCLPCRAFEPVFQRSAHTYEGKLVFASVNSTEHILAADQFRIRSVPTLIYFSNGNELERRFGALSSNQLTEWLDVLSGSHTHAENYRRAA